MEESEETVLLAPGAAANVTFLPPPLDVEVEERVEEGQADISVNSETQATDSGAEITGDEQTIFPMLTESGNELDEADFQGPHSWRKKLRPTKSPRDIHLHPPHRPKPLALALQQNNDEEKENEELDLRIPVDSPQSISTDPSPRSGDRDLEAEANDRFVWVFRSEYHRRS